MPTSILIHVLTYLCEDQTMQENKLFCFIRDKYNSEVKQINVDNA